MANAAPRLTYPPGLPGAAELPCEDGEGVETNEHYYAANLLALPIQPLIRRERSLHVAVNGFFYFSAEQVRSNDFRGPDILIAMGVEPGPRPSWVVWEEGRVPDIIFELTSASTARVDKVDKRHIYGAQLGIPEYYIFDPFSFELIAYHLEGGGYWRPVKPNAAGRIPSPSTGFELGLWRGHYYMVEERTWLRWYHPDGRLVLTGDERAAAAELEAATTAAEAQSKATELAARLAAYEARFGALDE